MLRKPEQFCEDAIGAGWSAEITHEGEKATVIAKRGDEEISIAWLGNACLNEVTHSVKGKVRKLRNASAARQKLGMSAAARSERSKGGKPPRVIEERNDADDAVESDDDDEYVPERPDLPFDPDTATDAEILKAVIGKRIYWRNSISHKEDNAQVMDRPNQRHLRIDRNRRNERCLTFAAVENSAGVGEDYRGPFRSVKLSSILAIK